MSYILDALRRAEAERERGQVPGLNSPGGLPLPAGADALGAPPAHRSRWPWLMLGLGVAAVALGGGWWLGREAQPPVAAAAPPPPAPSTAVPAAGLTPPAPPAPAVAVVPPPAAPVPPQVMSPPGPSPVVMARPARAAAPASAPARVPLLSALSAEQRQGLPALKVGGSMYSDSPDSRVLVLNDQLWHEGDRVAPELVLERIQPHSALLRWRGQRFELPY